MYFNIWSISLNNKFAVFNQNSIQFFFIFFTVSTAQLAVAEFAPKVRPRWCAHRMGRKARDRAAGCAGREPIVCLAAPHLVITATSSTPQKMKKD